MARLNERQLSVLSRAKTEFSAYSQRNRAALVRINYDVTFDGYTLAAVYAALRRVEKRVKAVVKQAIANAETKAEIAAGV